MKDRTIICIQCDSPFIFTVKEQERFIAKGFDMPKRCPECRERKSGTTNGEEKWRHKERKKHGRQERDNELSNW